MFKELSLCYKASFSVVLKNSIKSYQFLKVLFSLQVLQPFYQAFVENVIGLSNKSIQLKEQNQVFYTSQVLQNDPLVRKAHLQKPHESSF